MRRIHSVVFIGLALFSSVAFSFESPLGDLGGNTKPKTTLSYSALFADDGSVQNQKGFIQTPLWKTEESSVSVGLKNNQFTLSEDLILPGSTIEVPKSLKSTEVTLSYASKIGESETAGGRLSFGSSSDRTFSGSRTTSIGGTVFWSFPSLSGAEGRWILSLNYSNNNSLTTLPLPGFAYAYTTPRLIGVFGVPFAYVRWVPVENGPWTLSFFYLLTFLKMEAAYGPPYMNAFVRFDWGQETWMRADRDNVNDRLTYDEKKVSVGGRMPLASWLFAEAETGFAFDRGFIEGENLFKKSTGRARLDDSFFAGVNLKLSF
ncbi:MAG: hypothetical protein KF789_05485 [Bdellovibrionaceae bacterium]|nr:hypothetical protein [Pseudobdellovibrionaceae bacterium]